jgi:fatty-acyl-CoA synthase
VDTLLARFEAATGRGRGITFIADGVSVRVPWTELFDDARSFAAALQARGVAPGDHVALLGPTSRALVTALQAAWLAGAAVVPLPLPLRLVSLDEFVAQTRARVRQADTAWLIADPGMAGFMRPAPRDPPLIFLQELESSASRVSPERYERPAVEATSLAVIQYTSGSTADPRGVILPHGQVCANIDAMTAGSGITDRDTIVSWLPMYHDMGLIGLLGVPMTVGAEVALAAPQEFLGSPGRWPEWLSAFGATLTGGPNFAYALAARTMARASDLDLSAMRLAFNGAEPIDPEVVEAFTAAGARFGLDPGSMFCVYGLAEATLAVTFPDVGRGLATDDVDPRPLENEGVAVPAAWRDEGARRLPLLGRALPGMEVRVTDTSTGATLPDRTVGEIEVSGPSITPGYYRRPDATAALFHGRWLRTGDLGYVVDGELVVCGRLKDVIIVGGRKVFPQDVERAAAKVEGIRAGNVVAFGVQGRRSREAVVVVAETRHENAELLRDAVADRVRSAVGLSPEDVVLVAPGTIPKTSSGKLQRSLSRDRYVVGRMARAGLDS